MKRIMRKIKVIINDNIISIMVTLATFIVSMLIYKSNSMEIANLKILDEQFVINFIVIIVGFSVAIITILYSTFDKLREELIRILKDCLSKTELNDIDLIISNCFRQLKENTLFIFGYLFIAIVMPIYRVINIPFIEWKFNYISKMDMIVVTKLTIVLLTLFALLDIIGSIFRLIEICLDLNKKKQ